MSESAIYSIGRQLLARQKTCRRFSTAVSTVLAVACPRKTWPRRKSVDAVPVSPAPCPLPSPPPCNPPACRGGRECRWSPASATTREKMSGVDQGDVSVTTTRGKRPPAKRMLSKRTPGNKRWQRPPERGKISASETTSHTTCRSSWFLPRGVTNDFETRCRTLPPLAEIVRRAGKC